MFGQLDIGVEDGRGWRKGKGGRRRGHIHTVGHMKIRRR